MALVQGEGSGGKWKPSEGQWDAICAEYKDLGETDHPQYGVRHQGILVFQTSEPNPDDNGRPKEVRMYFTHTWGTEEMPSKFRKALEGWFSKPVPAEVIDTGFDPEKLVGKQCKLFLSYKPNAQGNIPKWPKIAVYPPDTNVKMSVTPDYVPIDQREKKQQPAGPPPSQWDQQNAAPAHAQDDDSPF